MRNLAVQLSVMMMAASAWGGDAVQALRTSDGQAFLCAEAADRGRLGYRIVTSEGVVRGTAVEVSMQIETLRCDPSTGVLGFQPRPLAGRNGNALGGFVGFSSLEFVAYTPNLKVVRSASIASSESQHRLTFSIPLAEVPGVLPRNVRANGEAQVIFTTLLRGAAQLGDTATGRVLHQRQTDIGTFEVVLSRSNRNLRIEAAKTNQLVSN